MASSFGQYTSGIEPVRGIAEAGGRIAEMQLRGWENLGNSLAQGIKAYSDANQEREMHIVEIGGLTNQATQLVNLVKTNPEYKDFVDVKGGQLAETLDKMKDAPNMSLGKLRGMVAQAKVNFSNFGNEFQMFTAMKSENEKRLTAEGIANAPKTEKVVEDLSYKAGAVSVNSAEPLSVQRGKYADNLTKDALWDDKQKVWLSPTSDKIDLSLALKNWDAGAKETLRKAEAAGNATATVMLEQLNALAQKRQGEEYRAGISDGQTTDEIKFDTGRANEETYTPSADALMRMRGVGTSATVDTGAPTADAINKLKAVGLTQENEMLTSSIPQIDEEIKRLSSTKGRNTNWAWSGEEAMPFYGIGTTKPPNTANVVSGIKSPEQIKESISGIEALVNQKKKVLDSIEQNKKELQQVQQASAETTGFPAEAKASLSVALPKVTVGTREKEIALSEEKTKDFARNWVTENMGITQTVTNPDGTTRTIKVTPSNFDSIYRTIKPNPKVVNIGGYTLLEKGNGEYEKLGETKEQGLDRAGRAKQMKGTFGREPIYEGDESRIYAPEGLIPEPMYVGTKEGAKLSGVSLVGTYTGGDFDKFKSNVSGLVQADSAIKRLIQISENPAEVTSFDLSAEAEALAFQIKAGSKVDLVGSQVTKDEWNMLDKYVVNPTKLLNLETAERARLATVLGKVNADLKNAISGSGVTMLDNRANAGKQNDVIGQKRVDKLTSGSR